MKRQQTKLSLHLRHPTRDLSGVCAALGFKPAHIWKKGDEARTPKGNKPGHVRQSSYCSISLKSSREPLPIKIEAALARLKPYRTILRKLSSTGGRASLYVGWFCDQHTGEGLDWEIMDALADLRIALDLNIYVPDPPKTVRRRVSTGRAR
jgi:hypothetical protein